MLTPAFAFFAGLILLAPDGFCALRVGAARIDVTPAAGASLPMAGYGYRKGGHKGIHDNLYVRAIVLDDSQSKAVIIGCDFSGFTHGMADRILARIQEASGIPKEQILLTATHTHGAPWLRPLSESTNPAHKDYYQRVEDAIVESVRQAQRNLQPGRIGGGTGKAYVNMNRRARMGDGSWYLGLNPEGPSDKSVGVVKFETEAGQMVALLVNYAAHGTALSQDNYQVTGDLPGVTSQFVERHFKDSVVTLFTSGAAGDQCPLYDRYADFRFLDGMARILGEEVIRVAQAIRTTSQARIHAATKTLTCPGQRVREGFRRQTVTKADLLDGDPVDIRLSLLRVGDVAFAGVSGEVLNMIGQRLKRESPLKNTLMLTHANGSSGYIPDDAAYEQISYEIYSSRIRPGCAENGIVNSFLQMMNPR